MSRRALQAVNAALALATVVLGGVQLLTGISSPVYGGLEIPPSPTLDSNLRFLGGLGLGIGLVLLLITPRIERYSGLFAAAWLCAFLGGIGRGASWISLGPPPLPLAIFTVVEIVGAPLLVLWQRRVAHPSVGGVSQDEPERGGEARPLPTLRTGRLVLRPFAPTDAPRVQELAGAEEIASTTGTIPHPYPDGAAEEWISGHADAWRARERLPLAVTTEDHGVVGAISLLHFSDEHDRAELGYWIGVPFWGRGYATEAAGALLRYAFEELRLSRVVAHHFTRNPASGRVLSKIGMAHEGSMREHIMKWGRLEDIEVYGVIRSEWEGGR